MLSCYLLHMPVTRVEALLLENPTNLKHILHCFRLFAFSPRVKLVEVIPLSARILQSH